jgi:hypothetical protein
MNTQLHPLSYGLNIVRAGAHPSFHNVLRKVPHHGIHHVFSGFMDDFGMLSPIDYSKLALLLRKEEI